MDNDKAENKFYYNPELSVIQNPEFSDWNCYLFGSSKSNPAFTYRPVKGAVPNWFIRQMMRICLGCTWIKEQQ
jgi:hypothetical protein